MSSYIAAIVSGVEEEEEDENDQRDIKYQLVAATHEVELEDSDDSEREQHEIEEHWTSAILVDHLKQFRKTNKRRMYIMVMGIIGVLLFLYWAVV